MVKAMSNATELSALTCVNTLTLMTTTIEFSDVATSGANTSEIKSNSIQFEAEFKINNPACVTHKC